MPIITETTYKPPFYQRGGHAQTIFPGAFRKIKGLQYERERLTLADGDFVDLDWSRKGNRKLVLVSHGLEGSSDRHYVMATIKLFNQNGWDGLAWNCRSCSGEMNKTLRLYHHGEVEDISAVIQHALKSNQYNSIALVGYSMGGAMSLNYLGKKARHIPKQVKMAVAISVPCNLSSSAALLDLPSNKIYKDRFLNKLKAKIEQKAQLFPNQLDTSLFEKIKVWEDFDNYFSAPMSGFADAKGFYEQASAVNFMHQIEQPILILNAENDPILNEDCSPRHIAQKQSNVFLEVTPQGGHVGFSQFGKEFAYSEERALAFCNNLL